jgi:hypothetical protein
VYLGKLSLSPNSFVFFRVYSHACFKYCLNYSTNSIVVEMENLEKC